MCTAESRANELCPKKCPEQLARARVLWDFEGVAAICAALAKVTSAKVNAVSGMAIVALRAVTAESEATEGPCRLFECLWTLAPTCFTVPPP